MDQSKKVLDAIQRTKRRFSKKFSRKCSGLNGVGIGRHADELCIRAMMLHDDGLDNLVRELQAIEAEPEPFAEIFIGKFKNVIVVISVHVSQLTLCIPHRAIYAGGARRCKRCPQMTNSQFELCETCSLTTDQCQLCKTKLNLDLSPEILVRIEQAIGAQEAEIGQAELALETTIAPFRQQLKDYEDALSSLHVTPSAEYEAAQKARRDAWAELEELQKTGQDTSAAQQKFDGALKAANEQVTVYRNEYHRRTQEVENAFPNLEEYNQARSTADKRIENAKQAFRAFTHGFAKELSDAEIARRRKGRRNRKFKP